MRLGLKCGYSCRLFCPHTRVFFPPHTSRRVQGEQQHQKLAPTQLPFCFFPSSLFLVTSHSVPCHLPLFSCHLPFFSLSPPILFLSSPIPPFSLSPPILFTVTSHFTLFLVTSHFFPCQIPFFTLAPPFPPFSLSPPPIVTPSHCESWKRRNGDGEKGKRDGKEQRESKMELSVERRKQSHSAAFHPLPHSLLLVNLY